MLPAVDKERWSGQPPAGRGRMTSGSGVAAGAALEEGAREAARERLKEYLDRGSGIPRHLVYAAAKLGLADLLVAGPRHSDDLAAALGAHAETLRRVLRGMVAIGLLVEHDDGRYGLDELGRLLRSDPPEPLVGRLIKNLELGMAWSGLLHAVRTGEKPFEHVFGEGQFARFARDPHVAALGAQANPGT